MSQFASSLLTSAGNSWSTAVPIQRDARQTSRVNRDGVVGLWLSVVRSVFLLYSDPILRQAG